MGMKIILAEEYPLMRAGLKLLIESVEETEIAGETGDGISCLEMIRKVRKEEENQDPLLLITELNLPKKSGFEILREVRETMPEVRVLILTACSDRTYPKKAADLEADGYLRKESEPSEFIAALQLIRDGKRYIQTKAPKEPEYAKDDKWNTLTDREREVLIQTAGGKLNKEIADSLRISERTVKNHLSSIFRKLEVSDRTQAAVYAIRICGISVTVQAS